MGFSPESYLIYLSFYPPLTDKIYLTKCGHIMYYIYVYIYIYIYAFFIIHFKIVVNQRRVGELETWLKN